MYRRIVIVTSVVFPVAFAFVACAKDPDIKVPVTLSQPTPLGAFAQTGVAKDQSSALRPLYFASAQLSAASTGPAPRLGSSELGSLHGITIDYGITSPSITRFDLGMSGLAGTNASASVQPTFNSLPTLDNKMLATPSLLRDSGIAITGTSQFVLPANYLNNGHPLLDR